MSAEVVNYAEGSLERHLADILATYREDDREYQAGDPMTATVYAEMISE